MRMWFMAAAESGPSDRMRGRDGSLWDASARCAKIRDVKMTDEFLYLDMTPEGLRWKRVGPGSRSSFPGRWVFSVSRCRCGDVNDNWSCLWLAEVLWPLTPDPPLMSCLGCVSIFKCCEYLCLSQTGKAVLRSNAAGVWSGQRDQPCAHPDPALERRVPGWHTDGFQTNGEGLAPVHQQHRHTGNRPSGRGKGVSLVISVNADINGKRHRSGRSNAAG